MDIKDIETVEQAKALAFDCIQAIEMQQNNLRALQMRISELAEVDNKKQNKDMKPKTNNPLEKLTGSPSATAVSDVAKGGQPKTDDEMDKAYQELNGEVRQGIKPEMEAILILL